MLEPGHSIIKRPDTRTISDFLHKVYGPYLILMLLMGIFFCNSAFSADVQDRAFTSEGNQSKQVRGHEQGNFKFRVDVNMVTTDVRVIGQSPTELNAEDFILYDNGVPQAVAFLSYDQLPIAIALLVNNVDMDYHFPILKISAFKAIKNLRADDQVALFSYHPYKKLSDFTFDRLAIAEKISKIEPNGKFRGTNAIYNTARYLRDHQPSRRCAILLVSHNYPAWSDVDIKQANVEVLKLGASFFNILTPFPLTFSGQAERIQEIVDANTAELEEIAELSGGALLKVDSSIPLQEALQKAIANFRNQYTIGFYPSDPGETGSYHSLEIKIKSQDRCPDCMVMTRKGYYTGLRTPIVPTVEIPPIPNDKVERINELLIQRSILTAGATTMDITDIPFALETIERTDTDGQSLLDVFLRLYPSNVVVKKADGLYTCSLRIALVYTDKKRRIIGNKWGRLERSFSETEHEAVLNDGILYKTTIPITDKDQITKVVVYDVMRDRTGSKLVVPFNVEKIVRAEKNGKPQLKVKLKINLIAVGVNSEAEPLVTQNLRIAAFYSDMDQDVSEGEWRNLKNIFKPGYFNAFPDDLVFEHTFPAESVGKTVRIVVHDEAGDKIASKFVRLQE